jgi:hypothetical protein
LKNTRICKKDSCENKVKQHDQVYCSRDCAPYGWYGIEDEKWHPLRKNAYLKKSSDNSETPMWIKEWRSKQKKVDKQL